MSLLIDITVESDGWGAYPSAEDWARAAISASLPLADVAIPDEAELSILLCDDARIQELNRDFRGQDKPTNVLSFPGPAGGPGPRALGDIAIALETVEREAGAERKTVHDHFSHLVAHGLLHILGYDHETDAEAEVMEALERRILNAMGIADPYLSDEQDHEQK